MIEYTKVLALLLACLFYLKKVSGTASVGGKSQVENERWPSCYYSVGKATNYILCIIINDTYKIVLDRHRHI
ncbi:uncharacterized protein METZ01_LOCUS510336 [marine metagenome]|uniref:Uncharacterized protein n=1 Tax=marine metagenome TaxID=408172 RepID=A0A383EKP4_9ZZZZ